MGYQQGKSNAGVGLDHRGKRTIKAAASRLAGSKAAKQEIHTYPNHGAKQRLADNRGKRPYAKGHGPQQYIFLDKEINYG